MIIYISETDKGKFSVYGDRLVCETELITVMFFDKSFSPNSMNYRILTAYEEIGTVAEFKELKQENARLGNLCDKLNKDYLEQKEISAYGIKELNNTIRQLKQAKQELIDELLEWLVKNYNEFVYDEYSDVYTSCITQNNLEEKLNELKGE